MGFLLPAAFALAALALPILLFYMLRLRRQPVQVSSLMLWQQVIQDQQANAPWQRIKRNLLLWLQLLILALLVMALARPYFNIEASVQGNVVLLLDASASMQATDRLPNRFAAAQSEATDLVSRLAADDAVTLILVEQTPRILTSSTTDHANVRRLISQAEATNGPVDWNAGLTLAAASAATLPDATVVIISDGGLGQNPDQNQPAEEVYASPLPAIPGRVEMISVASSTGGEMNNQGLVALSLRDGTSSSDGPQLFVRALNAAQVPVRRLAEIYVNEQLFDARWLDLPPNGSRTMTIGGLPSDARRVQVNLTGEDLLAIDDMAWAVRSSAPASILLVSQGNYFLEKALALLPTVTVQRADPTQSLPQSPFDLIVFDRVDISQVSSELPRSNLFIVAPTTSTSLFSVDGVNTQPQITRVQSDDPLLNYVQLSEVQVAQAQAITPPSWMRTIIGSADGSLLMVGESEGQRVAILSFDIHHSDLALQIDFPILMVNLLGWLLPNSSDSQNQARPQNQMLQANQPIWLPTATSADQLLIQTPQGEELGVLSDQRIFDGTSQVGIYTIFARQDGGSQSTYLTEFAVNLLSEEETALKPSAVSLGGTLETSQEPRTLDTIEGLSAPQLYSQAEWWWALVLLGLSVLLLEWWIYWRGRMAR